MHLYLLLNKLQKNVFDLEAWTDFAKELAGWHPVKRKEQKTEDHKEKCTNPVKGLSIVKRKNWQK